MQRYKPSDIEPKWQKIWDETGIYTADLKSNKPKYIAMSMFNYPSGSGIHIGHAMTYTISDVKARFKRQQGYESYYPIGWDAFGLPAENYAISSGVSPQESMATIIPSYHKQYKAMGWGNDWQKEISTHLPEYYKWTQWIFAELYRHDLVYQDSRMQWWCPIDKTVLANEQVIEGKCWRHDGPNDPLAEKREIKQWFFKITDYADELLEAIDDLDWTESVKLAQKNWIGRSVGANVTFDVDTNLKDADIVLLHGFKGGNDKDFFPWLVRELEARGANVYAPNLPNPDEPNIEEQVDYLLKNHQFSEKTIILTHSLGGIVAMKLLPKLDSPVASLIMVAPPLRTVFKDKKQRPALEKACDWQFDFKAVASRANHIEVLYDKEDDIVYEDQPQEIAHQLGAEATGVIANKPHFNFEQEPSILNLLSPKITVFTTRIDTIFSGAFLVLAPEHPLVSLLTFPDKKAEARNYITSAEQKSDVERQADKEKSGVFLGSYAINPANQERLPIWISDFVLAGYGTGAVFGDIHDERDYEMIKKYDIPARVTVVPEDPEQAQQVKNKDYCFSGDGLLIDSGEFSGLRSAEAREKITAWLAEKGAAESVVNYRMLDWSVSRQRYWGAPIPIINCPKCGPVLVPDQDLPVILPELTDFEPTGDGRSALARATDWLEVACPKCSGPAERETDTLDTYIDSSWYMYRYFDPFNEQRIFESDLVKKWEPIDFYNGADHATAHLLYARFIARFFSKIGLINEPEPFKKFLFNGKLMAADGQMFSKSKGNGVDPLEIISSGYGADALRTYLMFAAPLDLWIRWDPQGVPGAYRFLNRLWNLVADYEEAKAGELADKQQQELNKIIHPMIKKVTEDIENSHYNTAIAATMGALNDLYKLKVNYLVRGTDWQTALSAIVACVAPFAPHIADELWQQLGHSLSVHKDSWPEVDEQYLSSDILKIAVQINGKVRSELELPAGASENQALEAAKNDEAVRRYLEGKEIKKVIYIQDKIINIVVA